MPARRRPCPRAPLFFSAALAAAAGCSGAPDWGVTHAPAEFASPAPDLSSAPNSARRGSEFRIGLRALYALSFGDEANVLEHGTGDGFFILYRPEESSRIEGDILFEVVLERSAHEEAGTGYAAEYWRACAGFRWSDAWSKRSEPFLAAGASYSRIEISGGDLTAGLGLYGGVGVGFLLSRRAAAEIEAKLHKFWGGDGSGGGLAVVLAVAAGMRF
jgi:hypothetical protein